MRKFTKAIMSNKWVAVFLLIFFFPVGIYLILRHKHFRPWIRYTVLSAFAVLILSVVFSEPYEPTEQEVQAAEEKRIADDKESEQAKIDKEEAKKAKEAKKKADAEKKKALDEKEAKEKDKKEADKKAKAEKEKADKKESKKKAKEDKEAKLKAEEKAKKSAETKKKAESDKKEKAAKDKKAAASKKADKEAKEKAESKKKAADKKKTKANRPMDVKLVEDSEDVIDAEFDSSSQFGNELTISYEPETLWSENSFFREVYKSFEDVKTAFGDKKVDAVTVLIYTEMTDTKGNSSDNAVFTYRYLRDGFEELNYDKFMELSMIEEWRILNESDAYFIHPGIYKNLKSKYTDNLY